MNMLIRKPVSSEVIELIGVPPVTVADVKAQARIDYDEETSLIGIYIDSAVDMCELELQQKIIRQRVKLTFEGFGGLLSGLLLSGLGRQAQVESVTYVDDGEVSRILPADQYRVVNAAQKYIMPSGNNFLSRWPDQSKTNQSIEVVALCGYQTVPAGVKQWIQIMAATSYAHREAVSGAHTYSLDFIDGLLDAHRLPLV